MSRDNPISNENAILQRADALAGAGHLAEAAALCDQVLARQADSAAALNLKGFCLATQGDPAAALPLFKLARLYLPIHAGIRYNLAKALEDTGDEPGALEELGEVLKLESGHLDARLDRGSLRLRRGDLNGAHDDLSAVITSHPQEPEGFVLRGACLLMQRQLELAQADFSQALALDPSLKPRIDKIRSDHAAPAAQSPPKGGGGGGLPASDGAA